MTLKKYYKMLMDFEWDFNMQDPVKKKQKFEDYAKLTIISHESDKHKELFYDFVRYNTALIRNSRLKPKLP